MTEQQLTPRAALQAGHRKLYHYEKFNPAWFADTLHRQRVHCSDPSNLNDPWDCMPWYDTASLEDPEAIEQFIVWLRTIAAKRPEPRIEADFERRIRMNPDFRNRFIEGFSTSNHSIISQRRIYCLTPDPCSTLMWSHYGDNHRGICLEFNVENEVFRNAWEVSYSSVYPKWVPHRMIEASMTMLLTKSDAWDYEHEFRVILSPAYPDGHPLKLNSEFLRLPTEALAAVVVGCRGNYAEVAQIVQENAPTVAVKRMIRVPNHYRLTVSDCPPSS
jgi:hypothetical protein